MGVGRWAPKMVTWRKWKDRGPACVTWVILTWNNKQRKQKITQNIHTKTNTQNRHTKTNTKNRHTKKNIQKDRNTNTYAYIHIAYVQSHEEDFALKNDI